ncbi:MAG: hypothetical protein QOF10_6504 [Kribbellaceae bacterium]|jgi:hypothetical protein|nr:hypothetical protein [Kribbellaceae bacterium]
MRHYRETTGHDLVAGRVMAWHLRTTLSGALWRSEAGVPLPDHRTASAWVEDLAKRFTALSIDPDATSAAAEGATQPAAICSGATQLQTILDQGLQLEVAVKIGSRRRRARFPRPRVNQPGIVAATVPASRLRRNSRLAVSAGPIRACR